MRPIDADVVLKKLDELRHGLEEYMSKLDADVPFDVYERLTSLVSIEDIKICKEIIEEAPTVERPKGEWAYDGVKWKCNRCGKWLFIYDGDADMNFCPNCGADMRGEGE